LKNVLFMVDTSGSLYSNRISAVNAALVECIGVIRNKMGEQSEIDVYYGSFDEIKRPIEKFENIANENLPEMKIVEENGFYKLTLFSKLYEDLNEFFSTKSYVSGDFLIVLITDGKASDSMKYMAELNKVKEIAEFREATRIVARVGGDITSTTQDVFEFVDNNAAKIVDLTNLASTLDAQMVNDEEDASAKSLFDTLFN